MAVEEPFELLELYDGQVFTFQVVRWEEGRTTIYPPFAPGGKEIPVLRVYVNPEAQPVGLEYWDITSKTLIAQLRPYLVRPEYRQLEFTIRAYGEKPKKRFTVETRSKVVR